VAADTNLHERHRGVVRPRRVVSGIAAVSDADTATMEALASSIDPDALDALFADQHDGPPRGTGVAKFAFLGYELVVTSEGLITVLDSA
jgi:hypothetical protein